MKCEYCNKEHNGSYGSGRFCCQKCARGYSTRAKRLEINKKVSETLTKNRPIKKRYCISCKEQIYNKGKYCKICKKYSFWVDLYKKLGIYNTNQSLKIIDNYALSILFDLYFNKKYSLWMIYNEFGIWIHSIDCFFKKHEIKLRNLSKAVSNSIMENRIKESKNSKSKYKHGWHITWDNKKVYYRSSYELDYAKRLDSKKIKYEVEFKRFLYYDTQKNKYRIAIPDFYLPETNTIVEIKNSYMLDKINIEDRKKIFLKNGYKFELIVNKKY